MNIKIILLFLFVKNIFCEENYDFLPSSIEDSVFISYENNTKIEKKLK